MSSKLFAPFDPLVVKQEQTIYIWSATRREWMAYAYVWTYKRGVVVEKEGQFYLFPLTHVLMEIEKQEASNEANMNPPSTDGPEDYNVGE